MEKLDLKIYQMRNQHPTTIKDAYIELSDKYLHYVLDFWAEEQKSPDDPSLGWHDVYNYFDLFWDRNAVMTICIEWVPTAGRDSTPEEPKGLYGLYIVTSESSREIKAFSKKRSELETIKAAILKWKYERH